MKNRHNKAPAAIIPLLSLLAVGCNFSSEPNVHIPQTEVPHVSPEPIDNRRIATESRRASRKVLNRRYDCPPLEEFERRLEDALDYAKRYPSRTIGNVDNDVRAIEVLEIDGMHGTLIMDHTNPNNWGYYNIIPGKKTLIHQQVPHPCVYNDVKSNLESYARRARAIFKVQQKREKPSRKWRRSKKR